MKPILFKVTARFVFKDTGKPVCGDEYNVWLYDKDPITDDKMGCEICECSVPGRNQPSGKIHKFFILCDPASLGIQLRMHT